MPLYIISPAPRSANQNMHSESVASFLSEGMKSALRPRLDHLGVTLSSQFGAGCPQGGLRRRPVNHETLRDSCLILDPSARGPCTS